MSPANKNKASHPSERETGIRPASSEHTPLRRPSARRAHEGTPVEDLLQDLAAIAGEVEGAEHRLKCHVQLLRRRRVTWAEIGKALSVTRQAAWQRFGGMSDGATR